MAFHYALNASPQGDQQNIFVRRKTTRITFPHEDLIGDGYDQRMQLNQYQGMQQSQSQGMQPYPYQGMQQCEYPDMQQSQYQYQGMQGPRPGQTRAGKKEDTKDVKKLLKKWKENIEDLKRNALAGANANDPTSNLVAERVKILEDAIQTGIKYGDEQLEGGKKPGKTKGSSNVPGSTRTDSGHTLPRPTRAPKLDKEQQKKLDILNKAIDKAIQQAQPKIAKVASTSPGKSGPKKTKALYNHRRQPGNPPPFYPPMEEIYGWRYATSVPKMTRSTGGIPDLDRGYPYPTPDHGMNEWETFGFEGAQQPQWGEEGEDADMLDMVGGMPGGGYYC